MNRSGLLLCFSYINFFDINNEVKKRIATSHHAVRHFFLCTLKTNTHVYNTVIRVGCSQMIFNQKNLNYSIRFVSRTCRKTTNLIEPGVRSPRAVVSTFWRSWVFCISYGTDFHLHNYFFSFQVKLWSSHLLI